MAKEISYGAEMAHFTEYIKVGYTDLIVLFGQISQHTKKVKDELYRMLVEEFGYFG